MDPRPLVSLPLPQSTLAALAKAGYETFEDLASSSPENLAQELKLSQSEIQTIWSLTRKRSNIALVPLSQPVAAIAGRVAHHKITTMCPPIDKLLEGGLARGTILEISGPPGSPKEAAAKSIVKSFAGMGDHVIFADCQNMTSPAELHKACGTVEGTIHYIRLHTLPDLMVFLHTLHTHLETHRKVSLLVLNSVSFPFQSAALSIQARNSLLDQVKQLLAKACASHNIAIVTTSQLATKLIGEDGMPANFDSANARGVMVPQLGPSYLPTARSYRIIFALSSRRTGILRLLSRPSQLVQHTPAQVEYELSSTFELSLRNPEPGN